MGRRIFSAYPSYTPCILNHESVVFIQNFNLSLIKLKWNQTAKLLSRRIISIYEAPSHKYRALYIHTSPGLSFNRCVFFSKFPGKKSYLV